MPGFHLLTSLMRFTCLVIVIVAIALTNLQLTVAQTVADPSLLAEISKIKAIDNHAHPLKYVAAVEKPDDEYDSLPLEAIAAVPLPLRFSSANPDFIPHFPVL